MVDKKKFQEEDAQGYRIDILGRNIEVTEPIRAYIWDKISKIERFHNHIMYVHATLELHRLEHVCTFLVKFDHFKIKSTATSTDMYVSIDRAINRLQVLAARFKSRIQDHHKKNRPIVEMKVNVVERPYSELMDVNASIEAQNQQQELKELTPPKVIGSETKPLKLLNVEEAVMKMELSGDPFLIYRAEEDQKLKVMYRRDDGNYGIILPE